MLRKIIKKITPHPSKQNQFEKLPDEIIFDIFKKLPAQTLNQVRLTCKRFAKISKDERLEANKINLFFFNIKEQKKQENLKLFLQEELNNFYSLKSEIKIAINAISNAESKDIKAVSLLSKKIQKTVDNIKSLCSQKSPIEIKDLKKLFESYLTDLYNYNVRLVHTDSLYNDYLDHTYIDFKSITKSLSNDFKFITPLENYKINNCLKEWKSLNPSVIESKFDYTGNLSGIHSSKLSNANKAAKNKIALKDYLSTCQKREKEFNLAKLKTLYHSIFISLLENDNNHASNILLTLAQPYAGTAVELYGIIKLYTNNLQTTVKFNY